MTATDIGNQIGGFVGGILNPIVGKTITTETASPSDSGMKTGTIVIAVLAVGTLAFVVYLLTKKST